MRAAEWVERERPRTPPPPDPKYEALHATYLAEVEWLKNATASTNPPVPDAPALSTQNDPKPGAPAVSASDASALATQNGAAPTLLPDPSQPLPDAAPIVSVREVSSPPECSPPDSPPRAETPLCSTMAFEHRTLKRTWQQMTETEAGEKLSELELTTQRTFEATVSPVSHQYCVVHTSSYIFRVRLSLAPTRT